MNLSSLAKKAERSIVNNSSSILTAFGVSGTLTTAYLVGRATVKATRIVDESESRGGVAGDLKQRLKERSNLVWKLYIPAGISGVLTIGCVIGATRLGTKKTAAVVSLLTVSETAFSEYKEKVVEQLGEKKEQAIRDEIAQDRISRTSGQGVVIVGSGGVLCYEMHTGRYFNSDVETLRKAQNTINAKLIREMEATLSDFYYMVGLPYTSYSSSLGWDSDKMLELSFSTAMSDDGRPCISFEYNYVKPL